jgi:HK97 gp10 family phage protein
MYTFRNLIPQFITQLQKNEKEALKQVGIFGENKLNKYSPVDTGFLKSRNDYQTGNHYVDIGNYGCDYAIFQEFGTYKMSAHSFVRPTAYNHTNDISRIIVTNLKKGMR